VYGDRAFYTNEDAEVSTEPDISFVSWEALESGRVSITPKAGRDDRYRKVVCFTYAAALSCVERSAPVVKEEVLP
jgi:hypothetical protein